LEAHVIDPSPTSLNEVFASYLATNQSSPQIEEVAHILATEQITEEKLRQTRPRVLLSKSSGFRSDLIGLVLFYVQACVRDHVLLPEEKSTIRMLNTLFQVEDGEYYKRQRGRLSEVLSQQALWILQDGKIDRIEDLLQIDLQRAFSLGTDQFTELTREAVLAFLRVSPQDNTDAWKEAIRDIKAAYLIFD
jgi:hypothetical protein